jgi:membrane protein DedA with SNARE-associated domain
MLELAAIVNVDSLIETAGYPLVFLLVMAESGGVPVPGETALIAGAVFASQGRLSLPAVIAVAAAAAIVGDNIGYVIGQRGGRWLLQKPGPFHRQRLEVLATGEPFFERHGPKAVFFGRFILGLRTWASWLAGATKMRWRTFALWNALGGISWACAIGVAAYYIGRSAENAVSAFGIYGLVAVALAAVGFLIAHLSRRRLVQRRASEQAKEDEHSQHAHRKDAESSSAPIAPSAE